MHPLFKSYICRRVRKIKRKQKKIEYKQKQEQKQAKQTFTIKGNRQTV